MSWDTANNVVNAAALELSLVTAPVADAYTSTDANVVLLRHLLSAAGRALVREHRWTQLEAEHVFNTVSGTAAYALPTGFVRMLDQTGWNRTGREPFAGPVDAQGWQLLKSSATTSTYEFFFRIKRGQMSLTPTPTSTKTLAYEYVTDYWVVQDDEDETAKTAPTAATDILHFDRGLLVTRLKRDFLRSKGMDSTAASIEYDAALSAALGGDSGGPVLSLNHPALSLWRPVNGSNVPDSGFGG